MTPTLDLKDLRLLASPAYELVLYDRLEEAERQALPGLADDPECYGVLRPRRNSAQSLKAVSRDAALLLYSLRQPGRLPRYAARALGEDCARTIAGMILDGILEMEVDGEMVSGPAASALLCGATPPRERGALAAMSRRAVEYAAALELDDPLALSARLYLYNSVPASSRWRSLLPDDEATAGYLGLLDGPPARSLGGKWMPLPRSPSWLSWKARFAAHEKPGGEDSASTYKLYVSPACDRLRESVAAIASVVARSEATQWKIGKGRRGLLRPDKVVVYFREFAALEETALGLMDKLEGCAPQGVPFTAELAGDGLLSWGVDPPSAGQTVPWRERESWRVKICNRLALALARTAPDSGMAGGLAAARFALDRLAIDGIDTDTWTPTPASARLD